MEPQSLPEHCWPNFKNTICIVVTGICGCMGAEVVLAQSLLLLQHVTNAMDVSIQCAQCHSRGNHLPSSCSCRRTSVTLKLNMTASFLLLNAGSAGMSPLCRSATSPLLMLSSSSRAQPLMLNLAVEETNSRLSPRDAFLQDK